MKDAEVDHEEKKDKPQKREVEPPIVIQRE
jgi:hypothetical protein